MPDNDVSCTSPSCGCNSPTFARRDFIKLSGLALAAVATGSMPIMAGPFKEDEWGKIIPADKKLSEEWVKSLFARGQHSTYTKHRDELKFIGMPAGGFCCGTMYLGGDGKLWVWDIFNKNANGVLPVSVPWSATGLSFGGSALIDAQNGGAYVKPHVQSSPIEQGFSVRVTHEGKVYEKVLDSHSWEEVTFTSEYPIGVVEYKDSNVPFSVRLEAFSPFIPLQFDDSSLPTTFFEISVASQLSGEAQVEVRGWLQNDCCPVSGNYSNGKRVNKVLPVKGATVLECVFEVPASKVDKSFRPDVLVDDFSHGYANWRVEGEAFGSAPVKRSEIPSYQGDVGGEGEYLVNSHASAPGSDIGVKDSKVGKLTSRPFPIGRRYLTFYVGGGNDLEHVGVRLLIDGKVVASATGTNSNHMHRAVFDVSGYEDKDATLVIYDNGTGGWGNIGVSYIVQTDRVETTERIENKPDFGSMGLICFGDVSKSQAYDEAFDKPVGSLTQSGALHSKKTFSFAVGWLFKNSGLSARDAHTGNYYAARFGAFPSLRNI